MEARYINKNLREVATVYARLKNQYRFKYQPVFSASFDKRHEDGHLLDEIDLFSNLKIIQKLTESDVANFDSKTPLENQVQKREMRDSGWRFDKINSMTNYFLQNY